MYKGTVVPLWCDSPFVANKGKNERNSFGII